MAHIDVTGASFQSDVLSAPELVLVDFWAPWCGPCRMLGPVLEEVAKLAETDEKYKGKIKIVKVNVDEEEDVAFQYKISSIPAVKFFQNGVIVHEFVGVREKADLLAIIDKVFADRAAAN